MLDTLAGNVDMGSGYIPTCLLPTDSEAVPIEAESAGTGKDLLEATAAHVLQEVWGGYSTGDNVPTLLGQAFAALELVTSQDARKPGEGPHRRMERALAG